MKIFLIILSTAFLISCSQRQSLPEDPTLVQQMPVRENIEDFSISFPEKWERVRDPKQLMQRVIWRIYSQSDESSIDHPEFTAWDAPDNIEGFLTCMKLKRDRTIGTGYWYSQVIDIMRKYGADVQETGITRIGSERALWWNQTFAEGILQQKCYMVGRNDYVYYFCFTTRFLSPERLKTFDQITKTIVFLK